MLAVLFLMPACAPVVVGTAAVGTYKGATDERSAGTMVDDSIIATKVKTKLIGDALVKARHIDVDVLNGVVYLIGVVENDSQKRMAADIARGVTGVRGIQNQLMIGRTSAGRMLDDMILGSRIKANLLKNPDIRSLNIDVDVNNRVVTLSGMTDTAEKKQMVISVAEETAGTARIVDNIQIKN